jgi:uncharacterized membrane protein
MVLTGMGIALVFVATLFINLRLPIGQGGLIHLGNVPLFLFAIIYGKKSVLWPELSVWGCLI